MEPASLAEVFLTICASIFVAELTDKDALLLLTLATRSRPWLVFLAGSVAFISTTTVIITVGSVLVQFVPVVWIKAAGGVIMLAYSVWTFIRGVPGSSDREEQNLMGGSRGDFSWLLAAVLSLALLDLAGDATELLTIVFIAQFNDALLVFSAAVVALVLASGLETILGNRLGKYLTASGVRLLSVFVFLLIGVTILLSIVLA